MGRYYKKKKSRSVTCSYEEMIDFNTDGGSISVMGIHTPDDDTPRKMFPGLFQQFKHYKYLGCQVVGENAAQLPVDPMSVSYEAGEEVGATIDPRDVFDPILFHGCHGEDLGAVLNRLYTSGTVDEITASLNGFTESDDALDMGRPEVLEGLFYKALTDRTWRKFPIQGGIRLNGLHPLVYNLATNHYISPNVQDAEFYDATDGTIPGFKVPDAISNATGVSVERDTRFFTPSLRRLGWMDTRLPYMASGNELPSGNPNEDGAYAAWQAKLQSTINYATMPRIFMGVLLIPKSRRVKQFMRMRIVHYFKFAGFRGASMDVNVLGSPSFYEVGNDYANAVSNDDDILGGNPGEDSGGDTPTEKALIGTITLTLKNNTASSVYYNPVGTIVYGNLERTKGTAGSSIALASGSSKVWTWNDGFPTDGIDVGTTVTGIAVVGGNPYTSVITIQSGDVSRNIQIDINNTRSTNIDEEEKE